MITVTVYSTGPTCMRCTLSQRLLDAEGVPYVVVDLRENAEAREYVTADLGYSEAPVIVVDEHDHWSGFVPDQIKRIARINQEG